MTEAQTHEVTQLLIDWSNGDRAALDKLVPVVEEELRRLAHRYMRRERVGHTLQTTALVNEAFGWEHGVFLGSGCGSEIVFATNSRA